MLLKEWCCGGWSAGETGKDVQLHCFEGRLLGHDLVDVWLETGVCLQQLLAQTALHGRLDLGAIARWNTVIFVQLAYT